MKSEKNTLMNDSSKRKTLFRKLFEFQIELKVSGKGLDMDNEIQNVIVQIDELMEVVLHAE